MRTTTEKLLAACEEVLELAEAEQRARIEAVDALRELVRDVGPPFCDMPSMQRARQLIDATLVAERVEPVTYSNSYPPDSPHAAAHVITEPKYVVYLLGRSGDKKYDPTEFNYFNTFDKQGAKRMTLAEARIRTHELNSMSLGRATFGYERVDAASPDVSNWNEIR